MKFDSLHRLSPALLRALASSLAEGALSSGITRFGLQQTIGSASTEVETTLRSLEAQGFGTTHLAIFLEALADTVESRPDPSTFFELVLSGPEVPGLPLADTAAVMLTLLGQATREVLLVGYAVHNGKRLFEPLARRMEAVPELKVVFCLDIARPSRDTSMGSEVVLRFAQEFRSRHWPGPRLPELFYDPRALETDPRTRASLHAKCVVVDRKTALITSANFTEAAQKRNVEAGILVRHQPTVARVTEYFEGLRALGLLQRCPL